MTDIGTPISDAVNGDVYAIDKLRLYRHDDLFRASEHVTNLTLSKTALARVLTAWVRDDSLSEKVQCWASFVRRGYLAGEADTALRPIPISYEHAHEELIAEILGRLDEIGDTIDGEIDADERQEMMRSLTM